MAELLRVGMVAGEASGDQIAAHLISALKARRRSMMFAGIGGPRMIAQGFESHYPMEKLSVRGYAEVLRNYSEIMGIRRRLAKAMIEERPDLFIGVDSGDFNLGLERRPKDAGIPTIHYVSPSVWAWRGWPSRPAWPRRTASSGRSAHRVTTCSSRTMRPPGGSTVARVIPASSSALRLAQPAWPSIRRSQIG